VFSKPHPPFIATNSSAFFSSLYSTSIYDTDKEAFDTPYNWAKLDWVERIVADLAGWRHHDRIE
jgi:hypothetical protein